MKTIKKVLEFVTRPDLKVSVKSDNIGVSITKSEESKAKIDAEFNFPNLPEDSPIKFEDFMEVSYSEKENLLSILINTRKIHHHNRANWQMHSNIQLWIPENSHLKTDFENGKTELSGLSGTFKLESENGGIKILNSFGKFNLKNENGSIKMEKCSGEFILKEENGKIKMSNCSGTLDVDGENGPIKIIGADFTNAKVGLENGSIYYAFSQVDKGNFSFANENGKILLVIPPEIPYNIKATNVLGRFHIGLKGEYEIEKENGKKILKMSKGSEKVNINIQNRNGSIILIENPDKKFHFAWSYDFPEMKHINKTFKTIFSEKDGKDLDYKVSKALKTVDKIGKKISKKVDSKKIREKIEEKTNKIREKLKAVTENEITGEISEAAAEIGKEIGDIFSGLGKEISDIVREDADKTEYTDWEKHKADKADTKRKKIFNKIRIFTEKKKMDNEEEEKVSSQSKLKILQMLENGKITAEEAEKLLSAIAMDNR